MWLITGNPRSGTRTYASIARKCGVDIRHERMGKHGTSSCFLFTDHGWYPDGRHETDYYSKYRWNEVVLLVRNPSNCIASMVAIVGTNHQLWAREVGVLRSRGTKLQRMMEMWWLTNTFIIDTLPITRVVLTENLEENCQSMFGKKADSVVLNKSSGNRKAKPLTRAMLEEADPDMSQRINDLYERMYYASIQNTGTPFLRSS